MAEQSQKYIINFYADMKGKEAVLSSLKQLQKAQEGLTKTTVVSSGAQLDFASKMGAIANRALLTVPVWMALRFAIMAIKAGIKETIATMVEFQDAMAKLKSITVGTGDSLNSVGNSVSKEMSTMRTAILGMATESKLPLQDLTNAMYFFRTANLSTTEAVNGFNSTVRALNATGLDASKVARAVADAYNVMKNRFDGTMSSAQIFEQITRGLIFGWSKHNIELEEATSAYQKLTPALVLASDSYEEIIALLGFLADKGMRGARAGTLVAQSIFQMSRESKDLREAFGIALDPNKPIKITELMIQLGQATKSATVLTVRQSEALNKLGGTKGKSVIAQGIADWQGLAQSIEEVKNVSEDYIEVLAKIRMDTISSQISRLKNILKVLIIEFDEATGTTESFTTVLESLNQILIYSVYAQRLLKESLPFQEMLKFIPILDGFVALYEKLSKIKLPQISLSSPKIVKAGAEGFGAKDVTDKYLSPLEKVQKVEKDLLETSKLRKTLLTSTADILETLGINESQILELQIQELNNDNDRIPNAEYLNKLEELRLKQKVAFIKESQKEIGIASDLVTKYEEATKAEQDRLKKVAQLRALSPNQFRIEVESKGFDKTLITDFWNYFNEQQQFAFQKMQSDLYTQITGAKIPSPITPTADQADKLNEILGGSAITFWTKWDERAVSSAEKFNGLLSSANFFKTMEENITTLIGKNGMEVGKKELIQNVSVPVDMKIEVKAEGNIANMVAKISNEVKKNILSSEALKNAIRNGITKY